MTRKAFATSMLILAVLAGVQPWNDMLYCNTPLQGNHFPVGTVLVLSVLVLAINPLLRLLRPSAVFRREELLSVWCLLVVGMSIPGSGLLRYFYAPMGIVPGVAAANPTWSRTVLPLLPEAMFPSKDPGSSVLQGFLYGAGGEVPWGAWARPVAVWGAFAALNMWMMLCLTSWFRKQWIEHEHLSFPLVQLPLELCQAPGEGRSYPPLLRRPSFWIGVGIPALFHGVNGLCRLLHHPPFFPVPRLLDMNPYIGHIPGAWGISMYVYFSAIAIGFLLTLETTFSLWFFYWLFIFARIFAMRAGITGGTFANFGTTHTLGAYIVFTAALIVRGRRHLWTVLESGLRFKRTPGLERELMSYPLTVWGFLIALGGMVGWGVWLGRGGAVWSFLACMIWIMILVVGTRVIAQAGLLFIQCPFFIHTVPTGLGLNALIEPLPYTVWTIQGRALFDTREIMMPSAMNNMKVAGEARLNMRRLLLGMCAALVVAFLAASFSHLKLAYTHGTMNYSETFTARWFPTLVVRDIDAGIRPAVPAPGRWYGLGLGMMLAASLTLLRSLFFWWPVSPIGLLFCNVWAMQMMWFSLFVAWLMKWLVMRYGSGRAYRITRTLCLGLLMGDGLMAGLWGAVGLALGRNVYALMPI